MNKQAHERLKRLEVKLRPPEFNISRIEIVDAITGEVGGVLHVKPEPNEEDVVGNDQQSRRDQ